MQFVGCHVVAPSDMMDNRVAAIKRQLANAGLAGKVSMPPMIQHPMQCLLLCVIIYMYVYSFVLPRLLY